MSGCSASASTPTGMFDPCKEIADSAIRGAGFDPATKKVVETIGGYSVSCKISSGGGLGSLDFEHPNATAGVRTYESYLASAQSVVNRPGGQAPTITKVNGRDAYVGPQTIFGCAVNLRTATGVLSINVTYHEADDCPSAQRVAASLEPSIGSR
ncbi:DUF3558 family protein [Nocardia sp. CA-128927]|uniref:DUF3558 family protein n=1 Tax=Nocardia sp. CA-128927 TaxID=3239975 RepID=UPI003D980299